MEASKLLEHPKLYQITNLALAISDIPMQARGPEGIFLLILGSGIKIFKKFLADHIYIW